MLRRLGTALAILLLACAYALGQPINRLCVQTTAGGCNVVSATNPLPVAASITPSGTQDVNLTQIVGAAPSATNPLFVSPATASTPWAVTGSGTAGTAAAGVVTVQGIGSMTPLLATVTGNLTTVTTVTAVTGITNTVTTQVAGATFTNITTNTDTNVKASAGTFVGITVNTAGTTSTAKIYNDADGTCSSGLIATVNTSVLGVSLLFNAAATVGICVTTAGAGAADITILWR